MKSPKRIVIVVLIALIIRLFYVYNENILFFYDTSRDLFVVDQIASADFKILGPPSSFVGLYHGVIYYYLLLPAFIIGKGSPVIVAGWVAVLHSAFIFVLYKIVADIFDKKSAFISSLFFAFSLEAAQYGSWIANPVFALLTIPLIYYFLYKKSLPMSLFFLGMSIQFNFLFIYHIVGILNYLVVAQYKPKVTSIVKSLFALILATSTMIIADIKFGFSSIKAFNNLIGSGGAFGSDRLFGEFLIEYINKMGLVIANNLFPFLQSFGALIGLLLISYFFLLKNVDKNKKLIMFSWIFSYLPAASLGGSNVPHSTAGLGIAIIIIAAVSIVNISKNRILLSVVLLIAIISANLFKIATTSNRAQYLFAAHPNMILNKQLDVIDYTYNQSKNEKFSINTITAPLFINTTWSYLYNWYGEPKYGYLPAWRGQDQIDLLGNNLKKATDEPYHYLIFEDLTGIPEIEVIYAVGDADVDTAIKDEAIFGGLRVQKRELKSK